MFLWIKRQPKVYSVKESNDTFAELSSWPKESEWYTSTILPYTTCLDLNSCKEHEFGFRQHVSHTHTCKFPLVVCSNPISLCPRMVLWTKHSQRLPKKNRPKMASCYSNRKRMRDKAHDASLSIKHSSKALSVSIQLYPLLVLFIGFNMLFFKEHCKKMDLRQGL